MRPRIVSLLSTTSTSTSLNDGWRTSMKRVRFMGSGKASLLQHGPTVLQEVTPKTKSSTVRVLWQSTCHHNPCPTRASMPRPFHGIFMTQEDDFLSRTTKGFRIQAKAEDEQPQA